MMGIAEEKVERHGEWGAFWYSDRKIVGCAKLKRTTEKLHTRCKISYEKEHKYPLEPNKFHQNGPTIHIPIL